ncbi:MAG: hypothetical protein AAFQ89_19280 [Cyanobacteria bacterium J06626_18]
MVVITQQGNGQHWVTASGLQISIALIPSPQIWDKGLNDTDYTDGVKPYSSARF